MQKEKSRTADSQGTFCEPVFYASVRMKDQHFVFLTKRKNTYMLREVLRKNDEN